MLESWSLEAMEARMGTAAGTEVQPRLWRSLLVGALVAGVLAAQGCSTDSPPEAPPARSTPPASAPATSTAATGEADPTPSPSVLVRATPTTPAGAVARVAYSSSDRPQTRSTILRDTKPGVGYVVEVVCRAEDPALVVVYRILDADPDAHSEVLSSGEVPCDGTPIRNTALEPSDEPQTVQVAFTGDLSEVSQAFATVVPE
jgi:hypothetical protein